MFADFEDAVNDQLIEESEEWLANVLSDDDLYNIYTLEAWASEKEVEARQREKQAAAQKHLARGEELTKRDENKAKQRAAAIAKGEGPQPAAKERAKEKMRGAWGAVKGAAGTGYGKAKSGLGAYGKALKGGSGRGKQAAAIGGTAAGIAAGVGGAALLAKRMKKRKECRARFPNNPEKYKACVKS